jgi:DNA-binding NarL/FixJ family response regulator
VKQPRIARSELVAPRFLLIADSDSKFERALIAESDTTSHIGQARTLEDVLNACRERWDLVVVDHEKLGDSSILMPAQFPETPVVAIGGLSDDLAVQRFLDWGFAGYIPKTYSQALMVQVLKLIRGGICYRPHFGNHSTGERGSAIGSVAGKSSLTDLGLTQRQTEVLSLAATGMTNRDIANKLGITEGTVKLHMGEVFRSLKVENRSEAIVVAMRLQSVQPGQIQSAGNGKVEVSWLLPHVSHIHLDRGYILFQKDDLSDAAYYIGRGTIELTEIGVRLAAGEFFGEIGIFSPGGKRSCSARCLSDVELFRLDADNVRRLHFLNPQFAVSVTHLIASRLRADQERTVK